MLLAVKVITRIINDAAATDAEHYASTSASDSANGE